MILSGDFLYQISSKSLKKYGIASGNSFTPLRVVCLSLRRFSRNSPFIESLYRRISWQYNLRSTRWC